MKSIIVIESNPDLLRIIEDFYANLEVKFVSSEGGEDAVRLINKVLPDLIICNVHLEEESGISLMERVKLNEGLKEIPLALYSARSNKAERSEAEGMYKTVYWALPDDSNLALSYVQNLMALKKKDLAPATKLTKSIWRKTSFHIELDRIIEDHLDDLNLNLDYLAAQMKISSSSLQKNLKKYNGKSVSQYVREYRLHRAKDMMDAGHFNLTSLARICGFRNLSYFSRSFKNYFGISPSQLFK